RPRRRRGQLRNPPRASSQSRYRDEVRGMEFAFLFRRFAVSPLPVPGSWYALPLRLIVGFGFVQHGHAKLSRCADDFSPFLHARRKPFAEFFGWATIVIEIAGRLLILAGAPPSL